MKRVIVVDDASFMRLALSDMLKKNGFDVVGEAENGAKAIEMYMQLKPDIVTMDIIMPVMDGIEALGKIIEFDSKANVIMLSSMGQEEKIKESIVNGAKGFVVKPFNEGFLVETLNKFQ